MKPETIAERLLLNYPMELIDPRKVPEAGEIEEVEAGVEDEAIQAIIKEAENNGHKYAKGRSGYSRYCYDIINGAVCWHTDPGLGKVALALLNNGHNDIWDCQLITKHGALNVRQGDVIVFNADEGHAWISNSWCIVATVTVSKSRSKSHV